MTTNSAAITPNAIRSVITDNVMVLLSCAAAVVILCLFASQFALGMWGEVRSYRRGLPSPTGNPDDDEYRRHPALSAGPNLYLPPEKRAYLEQVSKKYEKYHALKAEYVKANNLTVRDDTVNSNVFYDTHDDYY
jgi:hypothetical protein